MTRHLERFLARTDPPTPAEISRLARHLATLPPERAASLRQEYGLPRPGPEHAAKVRLLAERFRQVREAGFAHDVSGERRDEQGKWTKGGGESHNGGTPDANTKGKHMPDNMAQPPGPFKPATVEGVLAAVEDWDPFEYYGLRVLHDGEGKAVDAEEGDILPNSWTWEDDQQTDEELEGASVLSFDPEDRKSIQRALKTLELYPFGTWVVVGSDDSRGHGQDRGEKILKSPQVLSVLGPDREQPETEA